MTNSQSRRAIDWVIRNLYFELGVDVVPESNPLILLILLCICTGMTQSIRTYLD